MNKLLVLEDIKELSNCNYLLEHNKNITLNLEGNCVIKSLSNYDLKINIRDNSVLDLETIYLLNKDINILINIKDESIIRYNILIINSGENKVNITINMLGNNSDIKIKLRVINKTDNSNIDINCNGIILDNTKNNILLEDLKGLISNDGIIKISPNIKVLTNEVLANHLVTIGTFDKEELFYLTSKGLSLELAKRLLIESFTTNIISEEFKEQIKMEVKNIE